MRTCTCLWGGAYNPIIPVFHQRPAEWRRDIPDFLTGTEIARGYVKFFEPDVFVEAQPNLLERIGLGALRRTAAIRPPVIPLKFLLACDRDEDWSELEFGLGITDVLTDVYERERRFQLRDPRPAYLVNRQQGTGLVEAVFGLYPNEAPSSYFARDYDDVFKPTVVEATPDAWTKVYLEGGVSPLGLTTHRLEQLRTWRDDAKFFVFDPARTTDLIDLWNLRIEPCPVVPIPLDWWPEVAADVNRHASAAYRPLQGNPHGVMRRTTVEFAGSIAEERRRECLDRLDPKGARESIIWNPWRTAVWEQNRGEGVEPARRLQIVARERTLMLEVGESDPPSTEFPALAPEFASAYSGKHARWVNTVNLRALGREDIATVLPLNVTNPAWAPVDSHFEHIVISTEGWTFPQRHKDWTETIQLPTHDVAIGAWLKEQGVGNGLSDAGQIAKQVVEHLEGLRGLSLLGWPKTVQLLDWMAKTTRTKGKGKTKSEETFADRTAPQGRWRQDLAERRKEQGGWAPDIIKFTERNVIRLGLTTKCPRCMAANWHSLTTVDYVVSCERCLKKYPFPQGAGGRDNRDWSYRVIGPFATPDFARGSYGALLALKALGGLIDPRGRMSYSTARDLRLDGDRACEVDYVAWIRGQPVDCPSEPSLVFGEAKSFGTGDLVKQKDLTQLRHVAAKFPGAVLVVSVMREEFTEGERQLLRPFVKRTRRLNAKWLPTNLVVLLTGVELFGKISIEAAWESYGGKYKEFADYTWTHNLHRLAEATQAIHLDLPPFAEDVREAEGRERRRAGRKHAESASKHTS